MAKRGAAHVEETPSTVVYTLLSNELSFDDFDLIVRSLHSYMVDDFIKHPENNSIHVKLGYQASIKNIKAKMGGLSNVIGVMKLAHVKENELSRLESLRELYSFGFDDAAGSGTSSAVGPTRRRPVGGGRRPTPYEKAKAVMQMGQSANHPEPAEEI